MIRRTVIITILIGSGLALLSGQTTTDSTLSGRGVVLIESIPPNAEAWLDGTFLGRTPVRDTALTAGTHLLSLYYPSRLNWNAVSVTETLEVRALGTLERLVRLPRRALIVSHPSEADVYRDSLRIGRTPMELTIEQPAPLALVLREDGYEPATVFLDSVGFSTMMVRLTGGHAASPSEIGGNGDKLTSKGWIVGGTLATGVISGVVAAALKERSNRAYDEYLVSRDPALRDRSRRLDTAAGVAFVIMQASIGILVYSLVSD